MDDTLRRIAEGNLEAWSKSDVVKTLKIYSAEDQKVCEYCRQQHGAFITISDEIVGKTLPPFAACGNASCRCYFRPEGISIV